MNRVRNQKEVVNLGLCPNRGGGPDDQPPGPNLYFENGHRKGSAKKNQSRVPILRRGGGPETWDKFRILTLFLLRKESL